MLYTIPPNPPQKNTTERTKNLILLHELVTHDLSKFFVFVLKSDQPNSFRLHKMHNKCNLCAFT